MEECEAFVIPLADDALPSAAANDISPHERARENTNAKIGENEQRERMKIRMYRCL